ncbi:MAG: SCP2 sterol-binding domain-containing protein [Pseudomonadales bacterium]
MTLRALRDHLQSSFHPAAAGHFDAVFRLQTDDDTLTFQVRDGRISFDLPDEVRPDATFLFDDDDTAWALLTGRADAFEAFMDGRFRSDGYLMWAFALMAMFESSSLPVTPTE